MTPEQHAAYIAAFIDGEGHIGVHPMKNGHESRSISFCNTEKALVDAMIESLMALNIPTRIHYAVPKQKHWSPRWTVYIAGGEKSFKLFSNLIPLRSEKKKQLLKKLIDGYDQCRQLRQHRKQKNICYCEQCSKPIYATHSTKERGGGRFCSNKCRGDSQNTRIQLNCKICGTLFEVNKSRKTTAQFCSQSCFGKSNSDRLKLQAKKAAAARWSKHRNE